MANSYLAPGVYVEEEDRGPKPIEGVSTSTAGFFGIAERGPVNWPILVTSAGDYARWFGGDLPIEDYTHNGRAHSYLAHAARGFFENGGQRLYVTRVLPLNATAANVQLFDRGAPGGADTRLLRRAPRFTGTVANPPLLYALDSAAVAVNDWLRVGDGSASEYRQAIAVNAGQTHVALDFPLSHSHNAGDALDAGAIAFTANSPHALSGAAPEGSRVLIADTSGSGNDDLTLLMPGPSFVEIGAAPLAEIRRVEVVDDLGASRYRLTLDAPLLLSYADGGPLSVLSPPAGTAETLEIEAAGGDLLIFPATLPGAYTTVNSIVQIGVGTDRHEIRRIGVVNEFELVLGAHEPYPAGSLVRHVTLDDDQRAVTAVAANVATLDSVAGIVAGMTVIDDPGGAATPLTVELVSAATNEVTLSAAPASAVIGIPPKQLTAAVAAGDLVVSLNDRLGLEDDDVLRIGAAPDEEYAVIANVPADGIGPTDAGTIVLRHRLRREHALPVTAQRVEVADGTHQATLLLFDTAEGTTAFHVTHGNGYVAGDLVSVETPSGSVSFHRLANIDPITPGTVTLNAPVELSHASGSTMAERAPMILMQTLDAGVWGNRVQAAVEDERKGLAAGAAVLAAPLVTEINLGTLTGIEPGSVLQFVDPATGEDAGAPVKVRSRDPASSNQVILDPPGIAPALHALIQAAIISGTPYLVRSREFRLTVSWLRRPDPANPAAGPRPVAQELFTNLSTDPRHSRYFVTVLGDINGPLRLSDRRPEGESELVRVSDVLTPAAAETAIRLGPEPLTDRLASGIIRPAWRRLSGGGDSLATLTDADYIGLDNNDPLLRTGLQTFRNRERISIVACPGQTTPALQQALIDHCEALRYRIAVLDGPPVPNDSLDDVQVQRQQFDSRHAALYYPWLTIADPFPDTPDLIAPLPVPPSGHMAGIYARTDEERGVHKAPANVVVRGITGLTRAITKGEHDLLNPFPTNINVIRDFRPDNRGIRVWGARVISSDPAHKYVNVRRLLMFVEESIEIGLQWVVFEPNAEPLWRRVSRTINNFLTVAWRNGALEGTKPEEAFFVKCDRTTMTQTDIDNGRLIAVVGIAPVKPAEYVIIRIGLWTANQDS